MANPKLTNAEGSLAGPEQAEVRLRKILVSTVYLETSATIDHALELANLPGAQFVLLHIIETPRSERNLGAFASIEEYASKLEVQRQQALQHLESVCARFRAAGAPCTPSARIGVPHEEILNEAAEIAAHLIVVGSTASPALTRFLLGSTAERVVRHASCSVLVARGEQTQPDDALRYPML
jgi:nucleotide-binding universal stress UspA family protein